MYWGGLFTHIIQDCITGITKTTRLIWLKSIHISRVSCHKGPTRHAYACQIGPFSQDTLDLPAT